MHYIYSIQNKLNNKIYVGQSIRPEARWRKHKYVANHIDDEKLIKYGQIQYIHNAIHKHGVDNFLFQIIEQWVTPQESDDAEIFWIQFFQSDKSDYGYNLTPGGDRPAFTPEVRAKISAATKKRLADPIERKKLSQALKGRHLSPTTEFQLGHEVSQEIGLKISESNMGKIAWNIGSKGIMKPNSGSFKEKIVWPTDDELVLMVNASNITAVAKKLGLDTSTVAKRIKKRKLVCNISHANAMSFKKL